MRLMVTGSAPIDFEVLDFLKIVFCVDVVEAYGMTENTGGACSSQLGDPITGHVGGPLHHIKIRLKDIPEMNYCHTNKPYPQGEICFFGSSIMPGYFLNPEKTAESLQNGRWLHSGDVGQVYPNGSIKIIDRAKNIFKLSQGEYIAPEKIENIFIQSKWIAQALIHGDSLQNYVLAILVVDPAACTQYAQENDMEYNDELMEDATLRQMVYEDMIKLANENRFNGLEKPK